MRGPTSERPQSRVCLTSVVQSINTFTPLPPADPARSITDPQLPPLCHAFSSRHSCAWARSDPGFARKIVYFVSLVIHDIEKRRRLVGVLDVGAAAARRVSPPVGAGESNRGAHRANMAGDQGLDPRRRTRSRLDQPSPESLQS
jgi:hypothetical protein